MVTVNIFAVCLFWLFAVLVTDLLYLIFPYIQFLYFALVFYFIFSTEPCVNQRGEMKTFQLLRNFHRDSDSWSKINPACKQGHEYLRKQTFKIPCLFSSFLGLHLQFDCRVLAVSEHMHREPTARKQTKNILDRCLRESDITWFSNKTSL